MRGTKFSLFFCLKLQQHEGLKLNKYFFWKKIVLKFWAQMFFFEKSFTRERLRKM